VVVPNGVLFGDGICGRVKERLLKDFNLHTIVRLPNGVFAPYTGIPTNLLSLTDPVQPGKSGTTNSRYLRDERTTLRPNRSSLRSSASVCRGGTTERKTSGLGECRWSKLLIAASIWTSRTQWQRGLRTSASRAASGGYSQEGTADTGDHG